FHVIVTRMPYCQEGMACQAGIGIFNWGRYRSMPTVKRNIKKNLSRVFSQQDYNELYWVMISYVYEPCLSTQYLVQKDTDLLTRNLLNVFKELVSRSHDTVPL